MNRTTSDDERLVVLLRDLNEKLRIVREQTEQIVDRSVIGGTVAGALAGGMAAAVVTVGMQLILAALMH
ncbi:hypothetical protein PAN31117_05429 [Pandoraea anapnoica]|uniref:Uncharacterized protein n=1 Tax=Pandoraea anapnoica TaxID=2508301 RepID=A0A5E5AUW3_9BURK|nr:MULTISPECIES: hypothetical protein [Pandoraea]VVE15002.1 hypothetical protein PIN31009_02829 [Pandoraea iniqua]VVE76642.1 hypothetical protein PAN31117_05429 [Pandoraea anapnoica]